MEKLQNNQGLVMRSTGSWYQVLTAEDEMLECRIKGKFRTKGLRTTNPVSVGDIVTYDMVDETAVITKIADRTNYIIRKSVNLSKEAHIIASNIDHAYLIVTLAYPQTSTGFMDRFLVTAEAYHIPVTLVFNKIDVYGEKELAQLEWLQAAYEEIGYPTMAMSATNPSEVETFKNMLTDKVNLLSGHSGVGKSTLINGVEEGLTIKTDEVSDSHNKGKHTTTFAEMYKLSGGGFIIDTPGIKGFGVIDIPKEDISHSYPEMRERMHGCKFHNCLHLNEPKCAIKSAVENEEIPYWRYDSYVSLIQDDGSQSYR